MKVGRHAHAAAADGGRIFVTNEFGRTVSVIEGRRVVHTISGFVQPGGIAAVGPEVAIVDVVKNRVTLIGTRRLRVTGLARAPKGPTHAVAGPTGELYVVDTRGGAISTTRRYRG